MKTEKTMETLTQRKESLQKMAGLFKMEELEERMEFGGWSGNAYADNDYQSVGVDHTWDW
jgi:hypothetical protein